MEKRLIKIDNEYCQISTLVDGAWGSWGNWSGCSMTCGGGQKFRARLCDSPLPNEGGSLCPSNETFSLSITDDGKLKQSYTETCNDNNCPTTTGKGIIKMVLYKI